ncbi:MULTISPECIES: electron transport complex subunit RsxD [unclassified Ketobacter]|uniref:electron transport complex subunit RsxD n=1 Tax=unclassified Ketobacter TaxID=2639109 RepID=UPI000F0F91AF|nr:MULTISPECIES: electron transport complex subunit RsxD [unclassified Ketobacter]RLT89811.1 MAG: electron transport complex subunit RsxD [Ketobacter sp. GenoA1]RLT98823.1 MAG: electron transport complex subunit RsxD [Ketobacter sp.]
MALLSVTSPHIHKPGNTGGFMRQVLYATLPGLFMLTYFFGFGTLINVVIASAVAVGCEALILKVRNKPIAFYLNDYSAVVTAILLALAIPPTAPWWLTVIGCAFAIVVAKHLYGGLGMNPFNPAMVGYVLLLISFPKEMTTWLPAAGLDNSVNVPGVFESLRLTFLGTNPDALSGATPLDTFKTYAGQPEVLDSNAILHGTFAGYGWEWVNIAFLLGGVYLIWKKIITWHIPVGMLLSIFLLSGFFNTAVDTDNYPSIMHHLLSGGTMLGAFFIATDPVTAATSNRGKIIYGFLIGLLTYVIRTWGGYPDAVAFSVLLMNLAAPTLDYYTQPRTYGHRQPNKGLAKPD